MVQKPEAEEERRSVLRRTAMPQVDVFPEGNLLFLKEYSNRLEFEDSARIPLLFLVLGTRRKSKNTSCSPPPPGSSNLSDPAR